ncbi:MAG: flagellar basal body rod protein FlgB, partial [Tardiphaga sp.]|nr:flagellar basal body rod protein FlgB [Tardiphaga sp.]
MAISDMPMLSALRSKMQWHQERQKVLADNVSNSDTPGFRPR